MGDRTRGTTPAAAAGVSVGLDARLSFGEAAALRWALGKIHRLAARRVVDVPTEHAECVAAAVAKVLDQLDQAEAWAEELVRGGGRETVANGT